MASALESTLPLDAVGKAMMIGEPALQRRTLERVVVGWLQRDAAAARDWLDQRSGMPAEWIRELINETSARR
jgi:hypothetical protein